MRVKSAARVLLAFCLVEPCFAQPLPAERDRPRLLVLTDIGGDPDDQQSMIRLMTYAGEFDIEGLIASASGTPGELKVNAVKPELIREIVEAYGQVRERLLLHKQGYPATSYLRDRIKSGNPRRGTESLGPAHDTEASKWIIACADKPDVRPLQIVIWGGSTELAQALWRVRNDRTPAALNQFLSKLRVHAIAHQDNTGPWIVENFPDLFYILSMAPEGRDKREGSHRGMYLGGEESLTSRQWIDTHVRNDHGPLGALYPPKTWTAPNPHGALKEGDSPSWLYFLPNGLSDPAHPEWGGWGGRFRHASGGLYLDAADTVGQTTDARAAVWRWRPAFQADFQARMDWCVKPFAEANHNPVAAIDGVPGREIVTRTVEPGSRVRLSAAGSYDPDGQSLRFRWFSYPEAGTFRGAVEIENAAEQEAYVQVPAGAAGCRIHVILEVTDRGNPALYGYRRVVLEVGIGKDRKAG